jgi:hypothetical protein
LRKLGERRSAGVGPGACLARGGKGLLVAAAERADDLGERLELGLEPGAAPAAASSLARRPATSSKILGSALGAGARAASSRR